MLTTFVGQAPTQIGIVVEDLDASMEQHTRLLGRDDWLIQVNNAATGMYGLQLRGQPGAFSERVALIGTGPQIELLQPLTGPSVHMEWLESGGRGLHHIAFQVPDIEQAKLDMDAAGHPTVQSGYGFLPDNTGGFAYFDTVAELGYLVELVQF